MRLVSVYSPAVARVVERLSSELLALLVAISSAVLALQVGWHQREIVPLAAIAFVLTYVGVATLRPLITPDREPVAAVPEPDVVTRIPRRAGVVLLALTLASGALTVFLFLTGGQGLFHDAKGYYEQSLEIARSGLFTYDSGI